MSTERTDQYPEVSSDDAGIVPPQGAAKAEWPKKIRTLTASELDRLTIDGLGRFYWDGKLVNYEGPTSRPDQQTGQAEPQMGESEPPKPVDLDQHAMDLLDRTAREISDPGSVPPADDAAPEATAPEVAPAGAHPETPELAATTADKLAPVAAPAPAATSTPLMEVRRQEIMIPSAARAETMRVTLTGWQSVGLVIALVGLVVGAAGLAASGLVAAHDWGCKAGVVQSYCPPPPPVPKAPPRPDIPA